MPPEQPQKSSLWIWTTLWLTALFDAFLILVVYTLLITFLEQSLDLSSTILMILSAIVTLIAIIIGSYAAAAYVLKRARIMKAEAGKYAGLSIIVPVIGSLLILGLSIGFAKTTLSPAPILEYVGKVIVSFAAMYLIIRSQLEKKGE